MKILWVSKIIFHKKKETLGKAGFKRDRLE